MKKILLIMKAKCGGLNWGARGLMMLFAFHFSLQASAQEPQVAEQQEFHSEYIPVFQYWKEHNIFQHLDLSVTAGTTGIGIEASSPLGEYFQLRR